MAHRILIITNRIPYPLNDGGNLAMRAMIDGYQKAGWAVYLLAMNTKRHPVPDEVFRKNYAHLDRIESVPVDNSIAPLATLGNFLFSREPNHAERFYKKDFAERLKTVLETFEPDVVQLESIYLATYLPHIRKYSKALTALRMHNIEYQVWELLAAETKNPFKKIYLNNLAKRIKVFEKKAWQQFDLLIPITEKDAEIVRNKGITTEMIVAPFGIGVVTPTNIDAQWCGYHIGAMDWLPNAEAITWFLNEVWPEIHKAHPEFQFYYAGRNMPGVFLEHNPEGVICMGEVPDANRFIADKRILIVPLRSGGGIRVKILEAMAAGKIIISTDVGMQGIDALPDVHYLPANDAQTLADKVKWCLENKDEAERIGINAMHLAESSYMQSYITQKLMDKVEMMVGSRK